MKLHILKRDITVFCVTARNFPDGIADAFHALENKHPSIGERTLYGISCENRSKHIVYKAAVEEKYRGEGKAYGCETFVIGKGAYLTETISNFMSNIHIIPNTFSRLLADPRGDKNFPCVEWYKNEKVMICMVKLKQDTQLH